MSLSTGTRLGPYEIIEAAGSGGMGEVYRARDTRLDRDVAIKVLPEHLSQNPALRKRFEREARAASSLNHPNICALYDIGTENGIDFLVMEFLEGETLDARLEKGPLPTEELLRTALAIADALDKAHRQGLIHRDLKPLNVMMTKSGAKLLDFGLAKNTTGPGAVSELTSSPTVVPSLTTEGTIVGTFQYMSPEQLEGKEADARSDIFAFGALLYEMATGKKAFEGKSQASVIAAILERTPPPVTQITPLAPPALERLIDTCIEKDPDKRRQTMHDVLLELKWVGEAGSQAGVPVQVSTRRRARERIAWSTAALLGIAAVTLGIALVRNLSAEKPVIRAFIPPPEELVFHLATFRPGPAVISPDGRRIAFVAGRVGSREQLWVRRIDEIEARPLPNTDGAAYPFWSPDSRMLGFFANGKLKKIDASGGPPLTLADAPNGKGGTWNEAGTILFAPTHNAPIHRASGAGGDAVPVTEINTGRGENSHRFPFFLPDGEHFLYLARASAVSDSGGSAIYLGRLDGTDAAPEILMNVRSNVTFASGHLLFIRENTLMAQPFDPGARKTTGDPFPIAEQVRYLAGAQYGVFSASGNGALIYQGGSEVEGRNLTWFDRKGQSVGQLGEAALYNAPAISPDGKRVLVEMSDPMTGSPDIWIFEIERDIRSRFTFNAAPDVEPIWSPDGSEVVFSTHKDNDPNFNLYRKSVEGIGDEELLLKSEQELFAYSWSKDGRYIAYSTSASDTLDDIWILPMEEGGEPFAFLDTRFDEDEPRFSPDGRWIGYTSEESGQYEIYVSPFPGPGRKWQISNDGGQDMWWRDDGREILYGNQGQLYAVDIEISGDTFQVGNPHLLFQDLRAIDATVYGDGEKILMVTLPSELESSPLTLVWNWTEELKNR